MKIVILGAGHWHVPLYVEPLLAHPEARIVGVSDSDPAVTQRYAERIGCLASPDWQALCRRLRPDLAFVFGVHGEMAEKARFLIAEGIPLVVEKPAGLDEAEVRALASAAAAAGVFNAVPLVFRSSAFMAAIAEHAPGESVWYADFKLVAGTPARYRAAGSGWVLDRCLAGGGTLLNLGVHFIDLFLKLTVAGSTEVEGAAFANLHGEGDAEDYAALHLRNGRCIGRVETAYLGPPPSAAEADMHYAVRTDRHYFRSLSQNAIEVAEIDGGYRKLPVASSMPMYSAFVADVIRQRRDGLPPVADLHDMAKVMRVVDRAYAALGQRRILPHGSP